MVFRRGIFYDFASIPITLLKFGTIWEPDLSDGIAKFYIVFRFLIRHIFVSVSIVCCTVYLIFCDSFTVCKFKQKLSKLNSNIRIDCSTGFHREYVHDHNILQCRLSGYDVDTKYSTNLRYFASIEYACVCSA